ncbi:hypothetical protein Dthio_PD3640 [Desulfonatronospira thiodismutans ASO3-1]|uniref:Uncharacterized protein n=1 Tax=Desulfonatronospira thiodismutans ASO3-1 TaxID=555779 RepID=D6SJY1_9BACT|nr:hypothetical protein [Desulfonatronospira thiodismutans]EFI36184.1 hypothetical protein Dthio_PD3640 [Desulfonatronospira thiodismutans ASO3-1]
MNKQNLKPTKQMVKNWKAARIWFKQYFSLLNGIGWTKKLFFRAGLDRSSFREWSPAWMHCWSQPGLKVKPDRDGRIFFTWPTEKGCATTCWWPGKDSELTKRMRNSKGKPQYRSKPKSNVPPGYINITKLYERWPGDLIEEFAAIPDMTKPNPINPQWRPMKLYSLKRIEEIETSSDFQKRLRSSIFARQH